MSTKLIYDLTLSDVADIICAHGKDDGWKVEEMEDGLDRLDWMIDEDICAEVSLVKHGSLSVLAMTVALEDDEATLDEVDRLRRITHVLRHLREILVNKPTRSPDNFFLIIVREYAILQIPANQSNELAPIIFDNAMCMEKRHREICGIRKIRKRCDWHEAQAVGIRCIVIIERFAAESDFLGNGRRHEIHRHIFALPVIHRNSMFQQPCASIHPRPNGNDGHLSQKTCKIHHMHALRKWQDIMPIQITTAGLVSATRHIDRCIRRKRRHELLQKGRLHPIIRIDIRDILALGNGQRIIPRIAETVILAADNDDPLVLPLPRDALLKRPILATSDHQQELEILIRLRKDGRDATVEIRFVVQDGDNDRNQCRHLRFL